MIYVRARWGLLNYRGATNNQLCCGRLLFVALMLWFADRIVINFRQTKTWKTVYDSHADTSLSIRSDDPLVVVVAAVAAPPASVNGQNGSSWLNMDHYSSAVSQSAKLPQPIAPTEREQTLTSLLMQKTGKTNHICIYLYQWSFLLLLGCPHCVYHPTVFMLSIVYFRGYITISPFQTARRMAI